MGKETKLTEEGLRMMRERKALHRKNGGKPDRVVTNESHQNNGYTRTPGFGPGFFRGDKSNPFK